MRQRHSDSFESQHTAEYRQMTRNSLPAMKLRRIIIPIKEKKAVIEQHRKENSQAMSRIESTADAIKQMPNHFTDWDESIIRQLVDTVKVVSADRIIVYLRSCLLYTSRCV